MDYREAKARLDSLPHKTVGSGVSDERIAEAERQLGVVFPGAFKRFLRDYGWISIYNTDLVGLGDDLPMNDVVTTTLRYRTLLDPGLPPHVIPVRDPGNGDQMCLDLSRATAEECPIVYFSPETGVDAEVAPDFSSWMADLVEAARKHA